VEFRILGPTEVWIGDRQLALTAAKQRALLATILLDAGRPVPVSRLMDAIWGDDQPASAGAVIQTYVSSLRRLLHRAGAPETIVTHPSGYLIRVGPEQLDLLRFEGLVADGRAAADNGRDHEAAEALRAALAQWRGPALDGHDTPLMRGEALRLDEMRLVALEERIAADLRLGRLEPLVGELVGLVTSHPLRERLRGQLMLTLYRLGRQADALQVYQDGRQRLVDELGIDPGPELRQLHQRILVADPDLQQREPAELAEPPPSPVPSQLPPAPTDLTGREAEVDRLRAALRQDRPGNTAAVCMIFGKAGIGKTALALHVAHAVRHEYPDGQLFATLRGADRTNDTAIEVLGAFLRALGVDPGRLPEGLDERTALLRSLLAGRRILIVLDDAGTESQVRPLLPAQPGCAALLTGRASLLGLDAELQLRLDVLDPPPAIDLLARIAGADRVRDEPAAAGEIVRLCGGLPLALRAVGARLAARPQWPLAVLAGRLRDERRRLDELRAGDLEVRASVELSYHGLDGPERLAFRRLGGLGLDAFSAWLLAPLLDVPVAEAEQIADRLADAQLLDLAAVGPDGQARYRMHDLIQLYARERDAAEDPEAERRAAVERLARCLLGVVRLAGDRTPSAIARYPAINATPAPVPETLDDPAAWLEAERRSVVATVERASALGLPGPACDLAVALLSSFRIHNSFDDWWRTHDAALGAARSGGDRRSEAALLLGLGQLRYEQDRLGEAADYYRRALDICRETGDRHGTAAALIGLATSRRYQGRFAEALDLLDQAAAICRALGHTAGLAECGYGTGYAYLEIGRLDAAEAALTGALEAYRAAGNARRVGLTLRSLGLVYRAGGRLTAAADRFGQAIEVFRGLDDRLLVAYGVQALAKVHIRRGQPGWARDPLRRCLAVCEELGDRFGVALTLRTIGELHLAAGEPDLAVDRLRAAVDAWDRLDLPLFRARTERDLATAYDRRGEAALARSVRVRAARTFGEFGAREAAELARMETLSPNR
jgi:DNA-binding SARP family transcriptional activator/tetratricopeptide (TPR) repeat protein